MGAVASIAKALAEAGTEYAEIVQGLGEASGRPSRSEECCGSAGARSASADSAAERARAASVTASMGTAAAPAGAAGGTAACEPSCSAAARQSILAHMDNLEFMRMLLAAGYGGSLKLIYIDPPFFSNADYKASVDAGTGTSGRKKLAAYSDTWQDGLAEYLEMMALRLMLMRDLLADDGTIWVHLDWHGTHYVRILLDEIFGEKNFVNEIIWQYKSGGSTKKHFARKHDNILVYSKAGAYKLKLPKEKSYNRGLKPYHFKGVEEFCDEVGWYTLVNMKDVWNIDMVGRTSAERTGYATQKPEALMSRIIECASSEGDLVADFFCGSGTFPAVAQKNSRIWLASDQGTLAIQMCESRLATLAADYKFIE